MDSQYSCFISYRRNTDNVFIKKFVNHLQREALKVTNIPNVFFDNNSIKWGEDFDLKIYEGIVKCYFFIPFYHNSYLHKNNLWCAKELFRAIEVEKKIRKELIPNYCFILPIIDRGSPKDFPDCIGKKNAKEIKKFRHLILNNKTSKAFEDFKEEIYKTLLNNFSLIEENVKFENLCKDIVEPSDEEIKEWIDEQKQIAKKAESGKLPILLKNGL